MFEQPGPDQKYDIIKLTVVSTGLAGLIGMCFGMGFSCVPITEPFLPKVTTTRPAPLSSNMITAFSASSTVFTDKPVNSSA